MNDPQADESALFTSNGVPMSFFIDITNIRDGTTLIRRLKVSSERFVQSVAHSRFSNKLHGGQVVHTAEDAQILLVDQEEPSSAQLAEEWPNKLTLHFGWVYRSINIGRYPGPEEDWGGYRVSHSTDGSQAIDPSK